MRRRNFLYGSFALIACGCRAKINIDSKPANEVKNIEIDWFTIGPNQIRPMDNQVKLDPNEIHFGLIESETPPIQKHIVFRWSNLQHDK